MIENLPGEEWREVSGSQGLYHVSNMGRVKSFKRHVAAILKPLTNGTKYWQVGLRINGKRRIYLLHRLVMLTFMPIDNPDDMEVNHLDFNAANCALSNLEWTTPRQNTHHALNNNRRPDLTNNRGTNHHLNRLSETDVLQIRRLCLNKARGTKRAVARQFNIHIGTLDQIVSGKTWKHLLPDAKAKIYT